MKRLGHTLRLLISSFQGHLPPDQDWPAVLNLANRAWLSPALYVDLKRNGRLSETPKPVRDYLELLHERNHERNRRLRAQLLDATAALNRRGVEPILLKGAVSLFKADDESLGSRMLSDLDIHIRPLEMLETKAVLQSLGYRDLGSGREFGRDQDVGVIELHDGPNPRSAKYLSNDLRSSSTKMELAGALAWIPNPTAQALHLIVHDMIKDGDYWSLRLELRHLRELANLASSPGGIHWEQLRMLMSDKIGRKALILQAKALEELFDVEIPGDLRAGPVVTFRHFCRLCSASPGPTGSAARLVGNISRGLNRLGASFSWKSAWRIPQKAYRRITFAGKGSRF